MYLPFLFFLKTIDKYSLLIYNIIKKNKGEKTQMVDETKKRRNTFQKVLIKETVLSMCNHPTADEVYAEVRERCPLVSKATVYRVLNDLAYNGELNRIKIAGSADRYDKTLCAHYHVKCQVCGSVADVSLPVMTEIVNDVSNTSSYILTGHNLSFEGICPCCAEKIS